MYPLPEKVSYKHKEYYSAEYLLIPEYNLFGKPKWPKLITHKEYEEIEKKIRDNGIHAVQYTGGIVNSELLNDFWYYIVQPCEMWKTAKQLDPFDKNVEYYLVNRHS